MIIRSNQHVLSKEKVSHIHHGPDLGGMRVIHYHPVPVTFQLLEAKLTNALDFQ